MLFLEDPLDNTEILRRMLDGDVLWKEHKDSIFLGTKEEYQEIIYQNKPYLIYWHWNNWFYPLGVVAVKNEGQVFTSTCYYNQSRYCASNCDFLGLYLALGGEEKLGKFGTNLYQTYCQYFNLEYPLYWIHKEERYQEEDNFFQKFLKVYEQKL
jgi:hypothetical protein